MGRRALLAILMMLINSVLGFSLFMQQFGRHFGEVGTAPHSPSDGISSTLAFVLGFPGVWLLTTRVNVLVTIVVHVIIQFAIAYGIVSVILDGRPGGRRR
jgi:hypothetical protein